MSARRRLGAAAVAAIVAATVAAPAMADDGTEIGGSVPSTLALGLSDPAGLGRLPAASGPRSATDTITALVTATDGPAQLTVADGDAAAGRRHGHLTTNRGLLASPLEVAGPGAAWLSLAGTTDPQVARWTEPLASTPVAVRLRQRVPAGHARTVATKVVLVTLSIEGP